MTTDYATLAEFHAYIGVANTDTANDTAMSMAITAASATIERECNRQFAPQDTVATTRYFTTKREHGEEAFLLPSVQWSYWYPFNGDWSWFWTAPERKVFVDDFFLTNQLITDIVVKDHTTGQTVALDRPWPFNNGPKGLPYLALLFLSSTPMPRGDGDVEVTAKFGWPSIPTPIKNATLMLANRYLKRKDSPLGGIAGSTNTGEVIRATTIDSDVENLIRNYRRWWVSA